jgi:hypothetical protein
MLLLLAREEKYILYYSHLKMKAALSFEALDCTEAHFESQ